MHDGREQWRRRARRAGRVTSVGAFVTLVAAVAAGCVSGPPPPGPTGTVTPGAVPLGTSSYAIPATGTYFVSPNGRDSAAGTQAAPWRNLSWAIANAPSGSTIVLRAGVYAASVNVVGKQLTIESYPLEAVTLSGAKRVTTATATPVGTRTDWAVAWPYNLPVQRPDLLAPARPLANRPEQIFVNGSPLRQVGDLASVDDRSFFVDNSASTLYLGVDPATAVVEASYLQVAIRFINAAGSILRGIAIDKYATPLGAIAPIQVQSPGMTVENVISSNNAAAGISVTAVDVTLRNDTFDRNGQLGVHAYRADRLMVDQVLATANNTEGFNVSAESGGIKITTSTGATVRDSVFEQNTGNGLWFDVNADNATIVRNTMRQNTTMGLLFELSANGVIAQNWLWGNLAAGITTTEPKGVDIWNNTMADNGYDLQVLDWTRPQTVQNVTIRNNVMYSSGLPLYLLLVTDRTLTLTAAQMNVTADYDAYCRVQPTFPANEIGWAAGPSLATYGSIAAFRAATGNEANGITCDGPATDTLFVDPAQHDWRAAAGSPLASGGAPLPPNVAAALGQLDGATIGVGAG